MFCYVLNIAKNVAEALNTLIKLVCSLRFYVNWSKVEGPTQHLTFSTQSHPKSFTSLYTDVCNTGGEETFVGDWCYVDWDLNGPQVVNLRINYKEASAVILTEKHWVRLWPNRKVIIHTKCR